MVDNIPGVNDPIKGLVATIPFNFYCIVILVMVFLFANNKIKDYGPMKDAEERAKKGGDLVNLEETIATLDIRKGTVSDMIYPLAVSVIMLVVLGLWNYTVPNFLDVEKIPLGGHQMLIISFSLGLIVAFVKYTLSKLMTVKEFLDEALEGTKTAIVGGMIIILAVTLGDLMRAGAPEGLGTARYLQAVAGDIIPGGIVPVAVFIFGAVMSFAMGTSWGTWGTWGILMPIAIPLAIATGVSPYLTAAAVLSGGTFGDHCSPISDTTIMSSIGAGCTHIKHVSTQLPYALTAGGIAATLFLVAGFVL